MKQDQIIPQKKLGLPNRLLSPESCMWMSGNNVKFILSRSELLFSPQIRTKIMVLSLTSFFFHIIPRFSAQPINPAFQVYSIPDNFLLTLLPFSCWSHSSGFLKSHSFPLIHCSFLNKETKNVFSNENSFLNISLISQKKFRHLLLLDASAMRKVCKTNGICPPRVNGIKLTSPIP